MTSDEPIAVAMSGGVDSSVAAAILADSGRPVFGLMLRLWSSPGVDNRCCSPADVARARRVAGDLGIPFYVLDAQELFRATVVRVFVDGYTHGLTPNPCIECNRQVRWSHLLRSALALGAAQMATGHYARLEASSEGPVLRRAVDHDKDQSYVLGMLSADELTRTLFPLGSLTKDEVREEAHRRGLEAADRPESQDLCFLGGRDYREVLQGLDGSSFVPGPILSADGEPLGEHQGLPAYTIGQRKGIGIAAAEPLYVIAKDVSRNALIVGPRSARGRREFFTAPPSWIAGHAPDMPTSLQVQIRYHSPARAAVIEAAGEGRVRVTLDEAAPDVAPGQYAMFYVGDRVLGGGMILA